MLATPLPGSVPNPPLAGHGALARLRLLDAAERLFAERGYAATSVRDITAEAGCNLAAVNYYFGGKANLYREAFVRGLSLLREQRIATLAEAMGRRPAPTLVELLQSFATAFVAPLDSGRGPLLFQLWMREQLDPQLPPETFAAELVVPIRQALSQALSSLLPALAKPDASLCVQSFIAQLANALQLRRCDRSLRDGVMPVGPGEHLEHIVRFTAAGIAAAAAPRKAKPGRARNLEV